MRWAIKHKSGRTLFATSDEFIANNRRKMGWVVEEVKMTSREQFEKEMSDKYEWFSDAIACADFCGDDDDGYYVGGDYLYYGKSCSEALFWLWRGWQASRAAIEVATPWLCGDGDNDTEWTQGYNDGVMATEKAIISAGLKVKKMIIQLNEIMKADIIQLEDYDMQLAFEIETVERQLQYADKKNDRVWHEKALKARDHMKRTRALIKTRLDKLYFGEERMIHGAILAQIRKEMPIGKFMSYVHRAKQEAGL